VIIERVCRRIRIIEQVLESDLVSTDQHAASVAVDVLAETWLTAGRRKNESVRDPGIVRWVARRAGIVEPIAIDPIHEFSGPPDDQQFRPEQMHSGSKEDAAVGRQQQSLGDPVVICTVVGCAIVIAARNLHEAILWCA